MGEEFLVSTSYSGYVVVGWAAGRFENDKGEKVPYRPHLRLARLGGYFFLELAGGRFLALKKQNPC